MKDLLYIRSTKLWINFNKPMISIFKKYLHPLYSESQCIITTMAAYHNWIIQYKDIIIMFLNDKLTKDVYMVQLHKCVKLHNEKSAYKLNCFFFGLKQIPRA